MLDASPVISNLDAATRKKMLELTDILSPNIAELRAITGEQNIDKAIEIAKKMVKCIALKMGGKGSRLLMSKGFPLAGKTYTGDDLDIYCDARHTDVIDTTGAGDAFNAGFASSYLAGNPPSAWLNAANNAASKVVGQKGAALRM